LQLVLSAGWGSKEIREAVQAYAGRLPKEAGKNVRLYSPTGSVPPPVDDDDYEYEEEYNELESEQSRFRSETPNLGIVLERPRDLTRRINELNAILRDLRPFQLKPGDDRALRQLWATLRVLAQASRVPVPPTFPSLAEAQSMARRR